MVDRLFKKGQSGQVSEFKNAIVSYRDIYRLYPETWLNDEIVNFYFELISDRASKADNLPQIHCFNTFFCSTLRDQGYNKVRRWTKRVDIFSKDLVLVPINQSYHWVLGVMDMKHKKVTVYDSLHGNHDNTLELFLDYLEKEHLDKKKTPIDTSDWKKETPKDIPRQENMSDCGAFTCTFAERLSRQQPFGFSQSDMVTIRRRIALNILNKAI
ncbi:Senp1 mutant in complex with sumo-1 [Gilbertella persicaria]|uniref:Senp1 mutant in complex with sumo-1 n=1 Tax=Gilbertella persicaria TaxID=101096 RepID=UPI00221E4BEA|nr:Senp1 mutant in complex with sumo-1 [Gilbertella persicaria]KAI8090220.1 Senp1 mutant in complex with sumo-1 [Gilbertella persicaria]